MDFSLLFLLAAFGGGLFGAAIGGQPAFIFTGFMVFIGVGASLAGSDYDLTTNVAFGPVFGPHIAFAGGAAAAAYAGRRGEIDSGRDIASPLPQFPIALLVGGLFGAGGYLVQAVLAAVFVAPGGSGLALTDTVALTVGISAIVARLAFGRTGLFGSVSEEANERGRFKPGGTQVWVIHQQGFGQSTILGIASGLLCGFLVVSFAQINPEYVAFAPFLGFGISAVSLIMLQFGFNGPVTHHMTLPGGLAAAAIVIGLGPEAGALALIFGALGGIGGALFGELYSRLFLIHGDTHVDPPAFAIFTMTTIIVLLRLVFGAV